MNPFLRRNLLALLTCALAIAPALADAPDVPKLPAPSTTSMPGYAAADPGCLEWANGCQTCQRQDAAGAPACSTPGIACTPGKIVCQRRK